MRNLRLFCGFRNAQPGPVRRLKAFTLIELLVVVAIITLLVSILIPSLREAHKQAKMAVCAHNLHQVGIGVISYTVDYEGWYPPRDFPYEPYTVGFDLTVYPGSSRVIRSQTAGRSRAGL